MPVRIPINISDIKPIDCQYIADIGNKCFGINFLNVIDLENSILSKGLNLKLSRENKIIGFCLTTLAEKTVLKLNFQLENIVESHALIIQTIAINPQFQRMGFGTLLINKVLEEYNSKYSSMPIYYPSWDEPKSQAFCSILINYGFDEIKTFENYWYNDSLANGYNCAKCGSPPCNCTMKLMKKSF